MAEDEPAAERQVVAQPRDRLAEDRDLDGSRLLVAVDPALQLRRRDRFRIAAGGEEVEPERVPVELVDLGVDVAKRVAKRRSEAAVGKISGSSGRHCTGTRPATAAIT